MGMRLRCWFASRWKRNGVRQWRDRVRLVGVGEPDRGLSARLGDGGGSGGKAELLRLLHDLIDKRERPGGFSPEYLLRMEPAPDSPVSA